MISCVAAAVGRVRAGRRGVLFAAVVACLLAAPSPASATTYSHSLSGGQYLYSGDVLYSSSQQYRLVMQEDGNLVLYPASGKALWSTRTAGHQGADAVMQGDGNLVVYQSGTAIWNSHTANHSGAVLDMQDDGNLVIYWQNKAIWDSGTNQPAPLPAPEETSPEEESTESPGPAALGPVLEANQYLYPGDTLYSRSQQYRLVMQEDGNLVLYPATGKALWSTRTAGHQGADAVMQGDGNLVVYQSGKAIWNSHTANHSGAVLDMQDDGNLVIYWQNKAIWATGTNKRAASVPPPSTASPGQRLKPGAEIYSPHHRYRLIMQGDGNLVLYAGSKAIWSTGTQGHPGAEAVMQGDGNFVVYWHGRPIWNSGTQGHPGARLQLQDDGNLVIYLGHRPLWASRNAQRSSQGEAIVRAAASQAGVPYCEPSGNIHGPTACGEMSAAFDCSGLAMFAVYQGTGHHVVLPHGAGMDHVAGGVHVSKANLKPGDLVFFGPPFNEADFHHVGIYAGHGMMWDANTAFWIYPDGVHKRSLASIETSLKFDGAVRYGH